MTPDDPPRPTRARTTRRRGRMSDTKRQALADLGPQWGIPDLLDPAAAFDRRTGPLLVDVGCGTGQATRAWAEANPDANVIALELHRPGVAQLLAALDANGPTNVRVHDGDATSVLALWQEHGLRVAEVRVLFPDPWPKRRHLSRRMADDRFVAQVADLLVPRGRLHIATDWDEYADHTRSALATEPRLTPRDDELSQDRAPLPPVQDDGPPAVARWRSRRPERPVTTYEQRGLEAGRTITDLVAVLEAPDD